MESAGKTWHDVVKESVVNLLRFYGFTASAEVPAQIPEGGWGRADVVGRKENTTIGVEIVDSGDVARDAKKLVMNNYDYRYIIVLRRSKKVDEVVVDGKKVKVLDIDSFEHELRRDLGVSPDYPYFSQPNIEKPPEVFTKAGEGEVDKLLEELEEYGLENFADEVLNALGKVYISRELPVEVRIHYNPVTGPTAPNEYESTNITPQILSILERLKLVELTKVGTGYERKTIAYPSPRGLKVGHELILKRIKEHKIELEELAREYGDKLWIMLYGSLWYTPGYYSLRAVIQPYTGYIPKGVNIKKEDPVIEAAKRVRILGRYQYFDLDYMDVPEHPTILLFSNFLVNSALKDDNLRFFNELRRYGLAIHITERDVTGKVRFEYIGAPIEVFQYLATKTKRPGNLGYYAQKFGVLYTILRVGEIYDSGVARKVYEELLQKLELNESAIAEVLADMNKRGITSRLITDPEKAPFIILDRKGFDDYLKFSLATIAEYFK